MIESGVLLIGVIFVTGFVFGKLTYYLRLTSIVGYVIAGILMGPAFNIVELNSNTMNTVVNFTLALIAFDIGGTFTMDFLKEAGKKVWIIILGESFGAFILVLVGVYILTHDMVTALIFASLAPASAPAGTVAALQETKAKGPLTQMSLAVVGLDDASSIVLFVLAIALVKAMLGGPFSISATLVKPLVEICGAVILGVGVGVGFALLTRIFKEKEDFLIISLMAILLCGGIAQQYGLSLILSCMFLGATFINLAHMRGRIFFDTIENVLPPIYIVFFFVAGTQLRPDLLVKMGTIGAVYTVCRLFGLMGGAYVSSRIAKAEEVIRKYLGFTILSQAGVAVGLACLVATELSSYGGRGADLGSMAVTIIAITTVIFQIIGPIGVRYAVFRAGEAGKA